MATKPKTYTIFYYRQKALSKTFQLTFTKSRWSLCQSRARAEQFGRGPATPRRDGEWSCVCPEKGVPFALHGCSVHSPSTAVCISTSSVPNVAPLLMYLPRKVSFTNSQKGSYWPEWPWEYSSPQIPCKTFHSEKTQKELLTQPKYRSWF